MKIEDIIRFLFEALLLIFPKISSVLSNIILLIACKVDR